MQSIYILKVAMHENSQIVFKLKCKIIHGEKLKSMQDAHLPILAWVKREGHIAGRPFK